MLKKIVIFLWFVVFGSLFFYSFTQVDLGLTLTRASFATEIQKSFQYVGYFNRPLSTYLFVGIAIASFVMYLYTLLLVKQKKLTSKSVWLIVFFAGVFLVFSYNAFSYDFFNYIFDAKIVTEYGQNPYVKKALDFPSDPMLGFMHWTHRTYPYGPVWLGITIPLSYMGMGYFAITFLLFKILLLASYLVSSLLIERICKKTKLVDPSFALAFFALSPFILIEGLISAHIDLFMMAIALFGVYLLFVQKKYASWLVLAISAGVKFATAFLFPLFLWFPFSKRKNKEFIFLILSILLMLLGTYLQATRTNFQPWYFLLVMPFAALLSSRYYVFIPTVVFSFLILFQYVPFLYTGNFDPPIPVLLNNMLLGSIVISLLMTIFFAGYKKIKKI